MLKKLFTHSFLYSIAPQIPKIVSLALMPVVTQYLTPLDYGIYGIITSYLYFVFVLKDLGFGVVFVNTFYKHPERWRLIWRLLHGHLIIWSAIYFFLILVVVYIAVPKEAAPNFFWISFLSISQLLLFDNTNTIGNYYFRFTEKPLIIAIVSILTGLVAVFTTYYCIVFLKLGYMSWFISSFSSALVSFICYVYPLYFKLKLIPIIRFRKKFILPYLKVALPMIPHNYSSYLLNSSDRVVMDMYKIEKEKIGYYNIAYQFGSYFDMIGNAIGMAVGPFYTKLYSSKNKKALADERNLTFFLMAGFLIATFLVSLWLKEIFFLMIKNAELQVGYDIGIIIIMGYAYRPMYWSVGIKLSTFENTSMLWKISTVAGILNIVLNILFVPFFGIYAAAINTLISLVYIGFAGYYFKSYKKLEGLNHYPLLWIITIFMSTLLVYISKDIYYPYKIFLTLIVLLFGIYFFRRFYPILKLIEI